PYACTAKLLQVFANQPQLLVDQAMPGLSHMRFSEGRERIRTAVSALSQGTLLLTGCVATVFLLLNRSFVTWWVGGNLYAGTQLTVLLIVLLLLRHWSVTLAVAIFCFGYERRMALQALGDGVLSLVAAVALTYWLGPI